MRLLKAFWFFQISAGLCCATAFAQVKLPRLISDGMVLQRDKPLRIWGWASPGEKVAISIGQQQLNTVTDQQGKWATELKAIPAGGPYQMDITASNHITIKNILIGD